MRECRGLIDSLMGYVQSCVAEENPDDKVNCLVSINRTFIHPPPETALRPLQKKIKSNFFNADTLEIVFLVFLNSSSPLYITTTIAMGEIDAVIRA